MALYTIIEKEKAELVQGEFVARAIGYNKNKMPLEFSEDRIRAANSLAGMLSTEEKKEYVVAKLTKKAAFLYKTKETLSLLYDIIFG